MKCAVLIGINYRNTDYELKGCINDVLRLRMFLYEKGVPLDNMVLLTDDTQMKPTRNNILSCLLSAVRSLKENDTLYFHYSGHGSQIEDTSRDELDSLDEVLVPIDYNNGLILDDEIKNIISMAPAGSNVIGIVDACNSETSFDLRYIYDPVNKLEAKRRNLEKIKRGKVDIQAGSYITKVRSNIQTNANVIILSGCRDNQTSADVVINGKAGGALTNAFLSNNDCPMSILPIRLKNYILSSKLSDQTPRLTLGRSDILLDKPLI